MQRVKNMYTKHIHPCRGKKPAELVTAKGEEEAMQLFCVLMCLGALAEVSGTSVHSIQPAQVQKSEVNVYKRDTVSGVKFLKTCQPENKTDNRN